MIWSARVFIQIYFEAASAAQHFVVKNIVLVVFCPNARQKLSKHGYEKTQVFRNTLQVYFQSEIADPVGWLLIEVHFDVAHVLCHSIDCTDLFRNVLQSQSRQYCVILQLLLMLLQIRSFLDNMLYFLFT